MFISFQICAWGMTPLLKWIQSHYNNTEIIVTENGFQSRDDTMNDVKRIFYIKVSTTCIVKIIEEKFLMLLLRRLIIGNTLLWYNFVVGFVLVSILNSLLDEFLVRSRLKFSYFVCDVA